MGTTPSLFFEVVASASHRVRLPLTRFSNLAASHHAGTDVYAAAPPLPSRETPMLRARAGENAHVAPLLVADSRLPLFDPAVILPPEVSDLHAWCC